MSPRQAETRPGLRAGARCNQGDPREDGQGLGQGFGLGATNANRETAASKKQKKQETGEPRHPSFLIETHADAGTPRNGQRLLRNFCINTLAAGGVPRPTRQEQRTAAELPGAPGCEHRTTGRGSALPHYARAWCQLFPGRQAKLIYLPAYHPQHSEGNNRIPPSRHARPPHPCHHAVPPFAFPTRQSRA